MTPRQRLTALESHLTAENPDLLPVLRAYRDFDRLLQRMGLLPRGESLVTRSQWWPLVAAVGPATSAKGAFLDGFRAPGGERDGRATLYCYGSAPGADPRIPAGLQDAVAVAASDRDRLRGRLLVDASGDAGQPAGRVLELADLVLVFPDGAQPEPDGLRQALATASHRADARKLLTVGADADLAGLDSRLAEAAAARGRRIAGLLDTLAEELEDELIPFLEAALARWRRGVRRGALAWIGLLALVLGGAVALGGTGNLPAFAGWLGEARPALLGGAPVRLLVLAAGLGGLWLAGHQWVRRAAAQRIAAELPTRMGEADLDARRAFLRSTGAFRWGVAGWGRRPRRRLAAIRAAAAPPAGPAASVADG